MVYSGNYHNITIEDNTDLDSDLTSANRSFIKNQYDDALKIYQRLFKMDKNNPDLSCQMGICYFFKGDLDRSTKFIDQSLSLDEGHLLSHKWKGNLLLIQGDPIEARMHLDRAIPIVRKQLLPLIVNDQKIGLDLQWDWLSDFGGKPVDKKGANKFFLACCINYQRKAVEAWETAREFAEEYLGDPENLWDIIIKIPLEKWENQDYQLHMHSAGHKNVWLIGKRIVENYEGDVRKAWLNRSPKDIVIRIFELFNQEPTGSAKLPRMILGGLQDTKQISKFPLDLAPDTHIRKVLGRMVYGIHKLSVQEALELSRKIYPQNPWLLDGPLYITGREVCLSSTPYCKKCHNLMICTYGAMNTKF